MPKKPAIKKAKQSRKTQLASLILIPALLVGIFATMYLINNYTSSQTASGIAYNSDQLKDIKDANSYIDQAEQKMDDALRMYGIPKPNEEIEVVVHEMVEADNQATTRMLAAEAKGVNLEAEGLIEKLCDSLGEQYAVVVKIRGGTITPENAPKKLSDRVREGQGLESAVFDITQLLEQAMDW